MICPGCKQNITDTSKFCKLCGTNIAEAMAANKPAASPMPAVQPVPVNPTGSGKKGVKIGAIIGAVGAVAVICAIIIAIVVIVKPGTKKFYCSWCGREATTVYYDPFYENDVMCEDCAREYFAPFDYTGYVVTDSYLERHPDIPTH